MAQVITKPSAADDLDATAQEPTDAQVFKLSGSTATVKLKILDQIGVEVNGSHAKVQLWTAVVAGAWSKAGASQNLGTGVTGTFSLPAGHQLGYAQVTQVAPQPPAPAAATPVPAVKDAAYYRGLVAPPPPLVSAAAYLQITVDPVGSKTVTMVHGSIVVDGTTQVVLVPGMTTDSQVLLQLRTKFGTPTEAPQAVCIAGEFHVQGVAGDASTYWWIAFLW